MAIQASHPSLRVLIAQDDRRLGPVLVRGDLRLDRVLHRARRGEVHIDLSRREFDLLETLMQQPGVAQRRAC